jgi:phosphoglucosamine mutase
VGDRYVVERMRRDGCNVGGEQSGHIVLSDHSTTGDGLIAALQVLAVLIQADRPASEVLHVFDPVPQRLTSVRVPDHKAVLERKPVRQAVAEVERQLQDQGRLVIRASGTEPKIRIMAEGDDVALIDRVVADLARTIKDAAPNRATA